MKQIREDERTEAEYLQLKLAPITSDELLDFYLLMTLAPSPDGFIAHYQHDCAIATDPTGGRNMLSLLFSCSSCQKDFMGKYFYNLKDKLKPECPQCGLVKFVNEVKTEER